jgi:hypothetical protein
MSGASSRYLVVKVSYNKRESKHCPLMSFFQQVLTIKIYGFDSICTVQLFFICAKLFLPRAKCPVVCMHASGIFVHNAKLKLHVLSAYLHT